MNIASQQYNVAVAEYFWRAPGRMGHQIAGEAGSAAAGARIRLAADLQQNNLVNVGFRVFACPHIIACCNFLAERLEGAAVEALRQIDTDQLQAKFEIPVEKAGKLLILKDAILACYSDYENRL